MTAQYILSRKLRQDIRRMLMCLALTYNIWLTTAEQQASSLYYVQNNVSSMPLASQLLSAIFKGGVRYTMIRAAQQDTRLQKHVPYLAGSDLQKAGCVGALSARGISRISALRDIDEALVLSWPYQRPRDYSYLRTAGNIPVELQQVCNTIQSVCAIRFLLRSLNDVEHLGTFFPHLPHHGHAEPIDAEMHYPGIDREVPSITPSLMHEDGKGKDPGVLTHMDHTIRHPT